MIAIIKTKRCWRRKTSASSEVCAQPYLSAGMVHSPPPALAVDAKRALCIFDFRKKKNMYMIYGCVYM